ncbi:MAG TPA: preprotein translocase subunit SecG [Gammaproteobacteria bacterium]
MLQTIITIVHVLVCGLIVGLVLLQRGKGAEAGTGFGAGASGTVFGARGSANFLSRTTAALATIFFVTCLALAYLATQRPTGSESLLERSVLEQTAPPRAAQPAQDAPVDELPPIEGASPPAEEDAPPPSEGSN